VKELCRKVFKEINKYQAMMESMIRYKNFLGSLISMKKIILLFMLIGSLPNFIYAEDQLLHVGISTGYPPFYFFDENQEPNGICIEVIHHVAKQLNISVQFSSYPWNRMIHNGKEGYVDAIMPLFKTSERERFLIFPETEIIMEDTSFFTLKAKTLSYSGNLNDITNRHIGVVENYSYGEAFDKKHIKYKTVAESDDQLIPLVLNKRVEMGIGNTMVITYFARKRDAADKIKFLSPPVITNPLYIGFSKAKVSAEFVIQFNKSLQDFKLSKNYIAIIEKYYKKK
jgi:polar amino acid transport system substrate-binding protein